jgi:hypothetical protein
MHSDQRRIRNVVRNRAKMIEKRNASRAIQKIANEIKSPVVADGGGLRKDDGKNMLELIPPEWIWGLGNVLTQGAEKYAVRNWERGMKWGKMIGCGLRHVFKFVCGERYDRESGCHHLLHAAWNFLSLMSYDLRGIGENDLPNFHGALGIKFIADTMDPDHPRTKKLRKEEEKRVRDSHARYEEKVQ